MQILLCQLLFSIYGSLLGHKVLGVCHYYFIENCQIFYFHFKELLTRYCCCSVTESCPTLWDPMDCSMPGFPVLHHFPELAQTHVHLVSDTIQLSCPLSSPSPPAFNLPQHQSLFQWVGSSHQVAKVLELQLQHQSFQWILRVDLLLGLTGWISLQSKGFSRVVFSNTAVWKHQCFGARPSLWSTSYIHTWLLEKP